MFKQAVSTLTLLGWCEYSNESPGTDFLIKNRAKHVFGLRPEDDNEEDRKWNAVIDDYGFTNMDEFDLQLLEGVQNGWFDEAKIKEHAKKLDDVIAASQLENSFHKSWGLYHNSFDDNEDEVVTAIYESFLEGVDTISPINVNGTVCLLKELNHVDKANHVIAHYMQHREENQEFFDLSRYVFEENITDEDLRRAFDEKFNSFEDDRNPVDVVIKISKNQSWDKKDIRLLSSLTEDNFIELFKEIRGDDLTRVVRGSLQFSQIEGVGDSERAISERATRALERIGGESELNRRRVRKFGIGIDDETGE